MTASVQPDAIPEATLDAAVAKAIAERDTGEHGYLVSRGYLDEDDMRGLIAAATPIIAAAVEAQALTAAASKIEAFADACSTRAERYAGELPDCANQHNRTVVEVFRRAAAIARAGTSGVTTT